MIKSIATLTILIILGSLILPWWIIVVISFLFSLIRGQKSLLKNIGVAFLSGFVAYLAFSIYSSLGLQRNPADLIAKLFGELPSWSPYVITALIGGITATFGGVIGYLGRRIMIAK